MFLDLGVGDLDQLSPANLLIYIKKNKQIDILRKVSKKIYLKFHLFLNEHLIKPIFGAFLIFLIHYQKTKYLFFFQI